MCAAPVFIWRPPRRYHPSTMRHKRNLFAAFGVADHSKALGLAASSALKATKIFPLEVEDFSRKTEKHIVF